MANLALLAYPDYSSLFEIYTDSSTRQLGAVIMQFGVPLVFFLQIRQYPAQILSDQTRANSHSRMIERLQEYALGPKLESIYQSVVNFLAPLVVINDSAIVFWLHDSQH